MKNLTKVLFATLMVFVMAACGSKYNANAAKEIIEKSKSGVELTQADYKVAIEQASYIFEDMKAPLKDAIEASKDGDYAKMQEIGEKMQEKSDLMDQLLNIIHAGDLDEANQAAYDQLEANVEEFVTNLYQ